MALIDNILVSKENFAGYVGEPPTNETEYNALLEEQDVFTGTAPTWAELQTELDLLTVRTTRSNAYPSIGDQLDMLYHDIKAGTLETGDWITAIETVKTDNPKPE